MRLHVEVLNIDSPASHISAHVCARSSCRRLPRTLFVLIRAAVERLARRLPAGGGPPAHRPDPPECLGQRVAHRLAVAPGIHAANHIVRALNWTRPQRGAQERRHMEGAPCGDLHPRPRMRPRLECVAPGRGTSELRSCLSRTAVIAHCDRVIVMHTMTVRTMLKASKTYMANWNQLPQSAVRTGLLSRTSWWRPTWMAEHARTLAAQRLFIWRRTHTPTNHKTESTYQPRGSSEGVAMLRALLDLLQY